MLQYRPGPGSVHFGDSEHSSQEPLTGKVYFFPSQFRNTFTLYYPNRIRLYRPSLFVHRSRLRTRIRLEPSFHSWRHTSNPKTLRVTTVHL